MNRRLLYIAGFIIIILALIAFPARAETDLESRLKLIAESQRMEQEMHEAELPARNQFGFSFTNFRSESNMLNPGFRLENQLTVLGGRPLKLITEAYYLRAADDISGFISLAYEPHPFIYFGVGGAVDSRADYQVFTGINITENIFVEAKGINSGEDSDDINLYIATGFKIGF